jgi:hypothetical protein
MGSGGLWIAKTCYLCSLVEGGVEFTCAAPDGTDVFVREVDKSGQGLLVASSGVYRQ